MTTCIKSQPSLKAMPGTAEGAAKNAWINKLRSCATEHHDDKQRREQAKRARIKRRVFTKSTDPTKTRQKQKTRDPYRGPSRLVNVRNQVHAQTIL